MVTHLINKHKFNRFDSCPDYKLSLKAQTPNVSPLIMPVT